MDPVAVSVVPPVDSVVLLLVLLSVDPVVPVLVVPCADSLLAVVPPVDSLVLPLELVLPSVDEAALPSLDEPVFTSVDEPVLPSVVEPVLPSVDEPVGLPVVDWLVLLLVLLSVDAPLLVLLLPVSPFVLLPVQRLGSMGSSA